MLASTDLSKVNVLIGGFHLPSEYLRQVMAELAKFDLEYVLPIHCSGSTLSSRRSSRCPINWSSPPLAAGLHSLP